MKTFVILFTLFYFLNALAVAPYGIKGQQNGTTLYSNVHQFPNNQVTNLGGINALVETGNKNLLINPSFEHSLFNTGWANLGTAAIDFISAPGSFDGKTAAEYTPVGETIKLRQQSSINSTQLVGSQGLASIRVKSSVALKVCSFIDSLGATATNCVNVQANSQWGLYKVPFLLGSVSSGISVESVGNVTGTIYIDDSFVGAVDLKADIDSSKIAGESYFAGTLNCQWSRTSTTVGSFPVDTDCPGPTVTTSTMGQWQTTDTDLPKQNIDNLPAGTYKATFIFMNNVSSGNPSLAITDGSTTCEPSPGNGSSVQNALNTVSCVFKYNSSGSRSFEILVGATSGAVTTSNGVIAPRNSVKFILEYFGSGSVYSSTNADTDWASCGHTTSSFTGFGTPTAIETQCKRQGGDLLMKGKFTAGTPTAVEARVALPLWNGSQLVSAGTSVIPSLQVAGSLISSFFNATYFSDIALIEPSVSYMTMGIQINTQAATTKATGTNVVATGNIVSFSARIPIEGWQQSNIIIGQFNGLESCTSTLDCTDTFSAQISAAGVVSNESVDFINGNCTHPSLGSNSCTFKTGIFTVAPNCVGTAVDRNNIVGTSASSTVVSANTANRTGGAIDDIITLVCQKQGADYIGKTAKAVASDQNVRSIGATGMDIQSVQFAGATISTTCTTSPCVIHNSVGSKITSVTRPGTGDYNLNGIDGTKYICTGGANASSYVGFSHRRDLSTSTFARIQFGSGATPLDVNNSSVTCIGIP